MSMPRGLALGDGPIDRSISARLEALPSPKLRREYLLLLLRLGRQSEVLCGGGIGEALSLNGGMLLSPGSRQQSAAKGKKKAATKRLADGQRRKDARSAHQPSAPDAVSPMVAPLSQQVSAGPQSGEATVAKKAIASLMGRGARKEGAL